MSFRHVAVWMDHREARIFHVLRDSFSRAASIEALHRHVHRHPKGQETDKNRDKEHPDDAHHFFHDVARALDDAEEVLVVGPSTAKVHFVKYVHRHDHGLESKIVGLETVDHPSDGQLVAYARHYFEAADRLR